MNTIIWENVEDFGCEYLQTKERGDELSVESTIISINDGKPLKVNYKLLLEQWKTKKATIEVGQTFLEVTSDGEGIWFDQYRRWIPELDGAIDIDISATPFSNSLPINRCDWKAGQLRDFEMVYVAIPSLELKKVHQRYTFVEQKSSVRIFRYESPTYQSLITVDKEGLVIEYPELFKRRY
ncbi:putative glycolipid-binding domain-containing protein [Pseudalkalibacillus sp. R45]|uniref:putative glycolipid-binding domain-containing protein n=1 Tax=Pseudalkalibacillus sp. R45 TaxID=3457433 RepID=UPI003FCE019F